jgi:biotin transport system substrate-specific component
MESNAATLRLAAVPNAGRVADVAWVGIGAAVIALSAQVAVALPFTPVPITGQTLSVLLVGAALGSVRGSASAMLYVAVGAAGAPIYAQAAHGWGVLSGATGGYLIALPLAAALTGFLAERGWDRRFSSAVGAMLIGNTLIFLLGLPWLAVVLNTNLEKTLEYGLYPFVPGDLFKLYLAAALLPAAWRLAGRKRDGLR